MTKGTRSLGRAAALAAPMLVALFVASCSGGSSSSFGSPSGTGTGGNVGMGGKDSTS